MGKVIFLNKDGEEKNMTIGTILSERMQCFGIDIDVLSEKSLVDKDELVRIINNEKYINEIDDLDLDFISQVLYCTPDYFQNEEIREKDVVKCALNRGESSVKSNIVKAKLQQFANDFEFLMRIYEEAESGV